MHALNCISRGSDTRQPVKLRRLHFITHALYTYNVCLFRSGDVHGSFGRRPSGSSRFAALFAALLTKLEIRFLAFHDRLSGLGAEITRLFTTGLPTQLGNEAATVTNVFLVKYRSVGADEETEFPSQHACSNVFKLLEHALARPLTTQLQRHTFPTYFTSYVELFNGVKFIQRYNIKAFVYTS
jgi:hypothetical protein